MVGMGIICIITILERHMSWVVYKRLEKSRSQKKIKPNVIIAKPQRPQT